MQSSEVLDVRRRRVVDHLRDHQHLVIALSGGVDSAVLLCLAAEAVGASKVVAVTGRSPAVTVDELDDAARVAAHLGVSHQTVLTHEYENQEYRANRNDRCFHCRTELFKILIAVAQDRAPSTVAYGAIVDDLGEDRPGMAAARQFGVIAPLLNAGLTKSDVRQLAQRAGLHVERKPANACLASRIPTGVPVTLERLDQVARAEATLRRLGFSLVRVRHHGDEARVELPPEDLPRAHDPAVNPLLAAAVREAGFKTLLLDPSGYRAGGANASSVGGLYSIGPSREGGQ